VVACEIVEISWHMTDPTAQYLDYSIHSDPPPTWGNYADLLSTMSMMFLYCLLCMTIYHISASLSIIIENHSPKQAQENIKRFNRYIWLLYTASLVGNLVIFFWPVYVDWHVKWLLSLWMVSRLFILIIMSITVYKLM
jgi:uncharacterized membrane protein